MSLKNIFDAMKKEGYVIPELDKYLLSLDAKDADRAKNVNAPSSVGQCLRARYYSRTGAPCDPCSVDARTRRIFDNGTGVHERLQNYLRIQGMLLQDEVPIINEEYNIQGHTDGILQLSPSEIGVLEIKSINSRNFGELKAEKPEHRKQGLVYLYCLETRRQYLQQKYATEQDFKKSSTVRSMKYAKFYSYLKDGSKFSKGEKIKFQVQLCKKADDILYHCKRPITKVIFLYENKDTQDLKEFCVSSTEANSKEVIDSFLAEFVALNEAVEKGVKPEREGRCKSDNLCRWCNYKTECWN